MNALSDMAAEIGRLRRDLFWTRCVVGVALLALAVAIAASWRRHPDTIEASEFLLKDSAGNVAARLGKDGFGDTCLTLTAKEHVTVASLCVQDEEGSLLDLHNLKSESRATLTPGYQMVEPPGRLQPTLLINEAMNTNFANLNVGPETKLVMGHNSKDSVRILSPTKTPAITLLGPDEHPVWSTH